MGSRQFLKSIIEANNIFRGEGVQFGEELKQFEDYPIDLGSRGFGRGVGPSICDTTVSINDLFRLPTRSSDDIMVKLQFTRNPTVRGSMPCVFLWYGAYANPSISNLLIPFVRS
jgi:hypothetical protein